MVSNSYTKKLLAINFGGLGDEVLFLPTLQTIKSQLKDWRITLLTEPRSRAITQVTDLIDDNITFDIKKSPLLPSDYFRLLGLLRSGSYDVVLSSGSSPLVAMLLFLSGIPKRIGFDSGPAAKLLLTNPVPLNRNQHAAAMYHDLAKGLGIQAEARRPEVSSNQESIAAMKSLLAGTAFDTKADSLILIHPGMSKLALTKGLIKTWSPKNWSTLIRRLLERPRTAVVLAGGPDDAQTVDEILRELQGNAQNELFLNAYGKTTSLSDLVALIELSDLLICVDSAPMHLAVGLDKPLVALFGPTDPNKLLWRSAKFVAVQDESSEQVEFGSAKLKPRPNSPLQTDGVQIQPDTVFRRAVDQLALGSNQGSSPEFHR